MNKKTEQTKKEDAEMAMKIRVSAVRTVMTMALKRSFKSGKKHFPGLDEHEYIAGLLMALVDATISILGIDRDIPRSLVLDMLIDLLKNLNEVTEDE